MRWKFKFLMLIILTFLFVVPYVFSQSSSTSTEFSITGYEKCAEVGSLWYNGDGKEHYTLIENSSFCVGNDEVYGFNDTGYKDDCCPVGFECIEDAEPGCEISLDDGPCLWVESCSNYSTKEDCENDACRVGVAGGRGEGTDICGATVCFDLGEDTVCQTITEESCRCVWDNGAEGVCRFAYDSNETPLGGHSFTCFKDFTKTDCVDNKMTVSWTIANVLWNPADPGPPKSTSMLVSGGCIDGSALRICGEALTKLVFFTIKSLIIAVCLIVIIYVIWISRKKKGKDKNRKKQKKGRKGIKKK